ncbi:GSU2403 family nucleotidyltransferase fold protein [Cognatiyoonia sp. IB215182]|uniref:nucleotidyltransferase family protein n=1 Tax=Cognatiyoonia sp. IB215182 TaxID=3097353 RepID=UPI002A0C665C|nr:GSU2403 family nucleotidyltransferase fold protein [Cognatiyoonia sp. IB215182]MDX8354828.1 GSU2403 family nucleotidyltransferase fold protein [Cognatiyoonia sp. IB215182]
MLDRHSSTAHAAYHDLLASLKNEVATEVRGTPTKAIRGGKAYWYDTFRVGTDVRKTYIGEDTPELATRLGQLLHLKAQAGTRQENRTRLIRILRAEGFMRIDAATGSLIAAMAKACVFRLGGTIVGTHAFRLYEGELGLRYRFDDAAQTRDMDIAGFERLSLALEDVVSPRLQDVFRDFSFEPVPDLKPGNVWRWKQTRNELMVEFLTPSFDADETIRPLAALGVDAQSLHHMNYLIQQPILAAVPYRSGVLVQIPQPERFAIHKLIVADRRKGGPDAIKSTKDRAQAAFLIRALAEDRPDELREAYQIARETGPRWTMRLDNTLEKMPATRAILAGL